MRQTSSASGSEESAKKPVPGLDSPAPAAGVSGYRGPVSKLAHLPQSLRHEICRRLWDGHSGREVAAWINARPAAVERLKERFGAGFKVTDQNMSEYRHGEYAEWLKQTEEMIEKLIMGTCRPGQAPMTRLQAVELLSRAPEGPDGP
jgi:hypothetical protein